MCVGEVQRLKELEKANGCLKRLFAERMLEVDAHKELLEKRRSVAQRRDSVRSLVDYGVSVQRACVLVQLQRATFLYQSRSSSDTGDVHSLGNFIPI